MPGVFGMVKRPKKIKLQAQDYEGKIITIEDDGWLARVMQHEFDHLNCTLIADKFAKITKGKDLLEKYGINT
jgi:peptide deformylase